MSNICPHTKNVCPVLVNLDRLTKEAKTPEEVLAVDGLSEAINPLLKRGSCKGGLSQNGDETVRFYSGVTFYCGSNNLPEIAQEIDSTAEEAFLGYSELFEIENVGKVRGLS